MTCGCRKIRRTRLLPPLARGVLAFCHLSVAGARNPGSRRVRPWACVRQLPLIPLRAYVQRKRRARMFSTGFAVSSCRLPVRAWTCRPVTCPKPQVASCLVGILVRVRFYCLHSWRTATRGFMVRGFCEIRALTQVLSDPHVPDKAADKQSVCPIIWCLSRRTCSSL